MGPLVRALVQWTAILVLCVAGFGAIWTLGAPEQPLTEVASAAVGGALTSWFGIQFGRAAAKRWRERMAVGRADEVDRPRDGEMVVARGTLHTSSPLTTPFTGVPAVAYGYKAWRREKRGGGRNTFEITYWWGEGSAPCTLRTRHGSLELRSRPWLDVWSRHVENTPQVAATFTTFLQGVQPQVTEAGLVVPGFEWNAPLDGTRRRDHTRTVEPPPFGELELNEWVIAVGAPVVVMGRYSAQRGGLVHDERRGRPLRVLNGDTDEVRAQLRAGALLYGALSLLAFGMAALLAGSILGWHQLGS